jgi:hypothetical protein
MVRFTPSRTYITACAVALGMAAFSAWCAWTWLPALIPTVLLLVSAGGVFWLATRPAIEVDEQNLKIRDRVIPWSAIRRVDQTNWISPMVLHLTTADRLNLRIIYPGNPVQSSQLLEIIQRNARNALLNGIPHAQIYGEPIDQAPPVERTHSPAPRYRLLNEEDEAEVERLYQKLKTAGRLDPDK